MKTSKMSNAEFAKFLETHSVSGGNFSDFIDSGGGDLIASLADNATSAYDTSVIANANPMNAALLTGGYAQTPYGNTGFPASMSASMSGGTGIVLLIVAAIVILFAMKG